jgi:mannose-6-phosphate isomerase-like protein (cupin superfamily)
MRLDGKVEKGWGHEEIWCTNDKYCGKFMHFDKGAKFSMHFHAIKDETWYVLSGDFEVRWIDTSNAAYKTKRLSKDSGYVRPKKTMQDTMSNDDIKDKFFLPVFSYIDFLKFSLS